MVLWRPIRPCRTNTNKRYPFHHRGWNAKVGGQEILGVTGKFGLEIQNEAGQRLTGASLVAQMAKHLPAVQETWVWSLGWEDPLERGKATHSSITAWRIPWQKSLMGYSPWGDKSQTWLMQLTLTQSTANRVLPREHAGHSKHPLKTHNGWRCTWTSPDGQYWNQIDYILCRQRWRSSIQSAKTRPGAGCGSDHELLIAKFRLKLKKIGETTRPFRYDLNQIPYGCTVVVMNRFKGLDLVDRVSEEL